ncbi:hypothetical protein GCM10012275_47400 [Longimycelium tulufanense]|uniref:DUF3558 domain-containing protein n=1 Tax=Longimycelium tulufanense TaxID=907463 RepID=A0A8J3CFH9_9PSEU|nr:DUF3558 domain-containing protein [Longimycelium tulufanense]GGM71469.1 hypothetical protein GCM10012275_47400 [Longimycelium tulufanense]
MPDRRLAATALAAAALSVAAAACSGGSTGDARPAPGTASSETTSAAPNPKPSDRPREVKLDGKDPCSLLTDAQKAQFVLDRPPRSDKSSTFNDASACYFRSEADETGAALYAITDMGIQEFGPGQVNGEVQEIRVQGFPAYEIHTPGQPPGDDFCTVNVDVADGQVLRAHYSEDGRKKNPLGKEEVCRRAARLADAAMTTLLTG